MTTDQTPKVSAVPEDTLDTINHMVKQLRKTASNVLDLDEKLGFLSTAIFSGTAMIAAVDPLDPMPDTQRIVRQGLINSAAVDLTIAGIDRALTYLERLEVFLAPLTEGEQKCFDSVRSELMARKDNADE